MNASTQTETKSRTITMTGRRPVKIQDAAWPSIAVGSYHDHDNQYEFQANRTWRCWIRVRQHSDGRCLVYGSYEYSTAFQNERDITTKAGRLLGAGDDPADGVAQVADDLIKALDGEYADHIREAARDCTADLPAEAL